MGAKKLVIFLCFQNFSISQIYVVKKKFLQVSTKKLGKLVSLTKTFPLVLLGLRKFSIVKKAGKKKVGCTVK